MYRKEIDGLRAFAIIPVVFFHSGLEIFNGGYIGVDIFFVISGYLITNIILEEIDENRFSILNFYQRRARRLLPALFSVIIVSLPFAWFWMLPDPLENYGQSLIATIFFSNNILLYLTSGYWDLDSQFKPFLNTWSLGVEEQFYIIFPILLVFFKKYFNNKTLFVLTIIFLLSLILCEIGSKKFENANFYLIFTRSWELLLGSFGSFIKKKNYISPNKYLSVLFLICLIFSFVFFNEKILFPSLLTLIPTLSALGLIIFANETNLAGRILGTKFFVFVGLISYSLYLWHYPIIAFTKIYLKGEPSIILIIFLIFISFFISFLSWKYIENPFRQKKVGNKLFLSIVLLFGILISFIGYQLHANNGYVNRVFDQNINSSSMHIKYNMKNFEYKNNDFNPTSENKILVIGNSMGRDIVNILRETYNLNKISLIYRDDLHSCNLIETKIGEKLFKEANLILHSVDQDLIDKKCLKKIISNSELLQNKVLFIGTTFFGNNLNWIARTKKNSRSYLRNPMPTNIIDNDKKLMKLIPKGFYISIINNLIDENNEILVTDKMGRLLSADRRHLTQYGAKYLGEKIFKKSIINDFF